MTKMSMSFEQVNTALIDADTLPWVPFEPYTPEVHIKLLKADPVRGETITLLRVPISMELPRHHHTGTVIVYTVAGAWRYKEHDWIARPGSVVFETAATVHTPVAVRGHGNEVITLNITVGELLYTDEAGRVVAIENWRTLVDRYLAYCKKQGIEPRDVTSFAG